MSLTVNIYYSGENGNALQFAQEMISSGIVNEIRAQQGNLRYEYFIPIENNNTVLLIDSWENQAALDKHHASPLMKKIIYLRDKYSLTMKVFRFNSDESEIPEKDKVFIKQF